MKLPFGRKQAAAEQEEQTAPAVLEVPPYEGEGTLLDRYWLTPPFAYANIIQNDDGRISYEVIEPKITKTEYIILEETVRVLRETLIYDNKSAPFPKELDRKQVQEILTSFEAGLSEEQTDILVYYLNRNLLGYSKIDPLLHDERIEDITCNGSDIPVYLYHQKYGNIKTNISFGSEELNKFVIRLAQIADKQVSLTTPLVDAALPGGARAQLTYSNIVSSKGSSFTIRKFKAEPMTPVDLIRTNTYSSELLALIWLAVENRKSIIIAGGTASGKTSTMNAVSFFIPSDAKIVSIEDTREIQLPHENWLPMQTRESIGSAKGGSIDMFSLLKSALRQRPEYIIVGEVRGEEAQTLFQAMNTGHTTFSTLHAGSVREAVSRLTHEPINVPPAMFSALHLVIIQGLLYGEGKGFRRCMSLNEVSVTENDVKWKPLFEWDAASDTCRRTANESEVFRMVALQNGWSEEEFRDQILRRKAKLDELSAGQELSTEETGSAIFSVCGE